jgi:Protein of unknown function (DUF2937)
MLNWIGKLIDRTFVVIGALIFSQAPLYMQQYTQQLSGHVAELNIQVDAMKKTAQQADKTLEQFIQKFLASGDADFRMQGELMQGMIERWNHLTEGLLAMQSTGLWQRPYVFAKYFNWDIAASTFQHYKIGIPLTIEGLIYALAGMLLGYAFFLLIRQFFRFLGRPFKRKVPEAKPNVEE